MKSQLWESDVSPECRTLIDLYYNFPDNEYPENRVMTLDIEIETKHGFENMHLAQDVVNAIAIHDSQTNKYYAFILDYNGSIDRDKISENKDIHINFYNNEKDLLCDWLDTFVSLRPTIITGWNIEFFDIPYLVRRISKLLGSEWLNKLSPIGIIRYSEFKERFIIAGLNIVDYLALYKKFTFSEQANYRLDSIAKKELGYGKIEFEGTLETLYRDDINKFLEYNINDVKLVVEIDNKKKLIDLAIGLSHKGKIPYEDVFYPSKYLEGAILSFLKKENLVVPNKPPRDQISHKFEGAYVKQPIPGLYDWIYDLDLTSLYPSIIMSLNISPETKLGKVVNWNELDFHNRKERNWTVSAARTDVTSNIELNTDGLVELLTDSKCSISSNGIIYKPHSEYGVIPSILSKWFDERVEYKNLMKKYGKSNDKEKYDFYDKLQNIQKVLLNSLYGVLGLPVFRFYDLDNAAAVTLTGQTIIKSSAAKVNEYYKNILGTNEDHVVYIDTDSVFVSAKPLLDKLYSDTDPNDTKKIITNVAEIVDSVQKYINDSYDLLATHQLFITSGKHRFQIKQELICLSGLWTAKKRYALFVLSREGILVNKLKVTGLDTVRSSFPPAFAGFMEKTIKNILEKIPKSQIDSEILSLEDNLINIEVSKICKNTSISDITKYSSTAEDLFYNERIFSPIKKGTPAHVKAAMAYNDLIRHYKLEAKYNFIRNKDKVKWCYLRKNKLGLDKIAFKGFDDPPEIMKFIELYIDKQVMYERELKSKLENIFDAMNWKFPNKMQVRASRFFNIN